MKRNPPRLTAWGERRFDMSTGNNLKELTLLSGEGEATFRLIAGGKMEVEMFDQRILKDVFDASDRNRLATWLVGEILQTKMED